MRAAPLKGDCLICQAPEPTRVAINAAIWPGDGIARAVDYRAAAVRVAHDSGVPRLATLEAKTITRHADHIEASWREVGPSDRFRAGEVPVATDFASVMDGNARVGAKATGLLEKLIDEHGEMLVVLNPKLVLGISQLGMKAAEVRESSRLKQNRQLIDLTAIFGVSSGHAPPVPSDGEEEADLEDLRATLDTERKLLAERASMS